MLSGEPVCRSAESVFRQHADRLRDPDGWRPIAGHQEGFAKGDQFLSENGRFIQFRIGPVSAAVEQVRIKEHITPSECCIILEEAERDSEIPTVNVDSGPVDKAAHAVRKG